MSMSISMQKYFDDLNREVMKAFEVANKARSKGYDPEESVEIPLAKNMVERVVGLISVVKPEIKNTKLAERIAELEEEFGAQDWRVALKIAEEVAKEKFCRFKDKKEAMEVGIRTGLAYVTVGVVASPLEGFVELKIRKRRDKGEYFALMYSGPIRSAGGTAGAVSIVIADYVRIKMGYNTYDPDEREVKRMVAEINDYHERVTNLQYLPSEEEIIFLVKNLPVQIDGDGSEKYEVSNYKDLDRIETNRLRNGICLVLCEALAQKAPKLWKQIGKWGEDFELGHWKFLNDFVELQKNIKAKGEKIEDNVKIKPDYTFIKDLVAGRPVLTHPLRTGGFRLRYGRCRISGFSSDAISPATMIVLDSFIAVGTQLKTERPGKATAISVCNKIEGPILKLKDGSVVYVDNEEDAEKYVKDIDEILFLGDILINYGDFLDRAHKLVPCGFNEEWYRLLLKKTDSKLELVKKLIKKPYMKIGAEESIMLSKKLNVPLHPRYTYHWKDITKEQFLKLLEWFNRSEAIDDKIVLPLTFDEQEVSGVDPKRVLELLGVPHKVVMKQKVVIEDEDAIAFSFCLNKGDIKGVEGNDILKILKETCGVEIKDKSGTFIGARMGRPEKAKMRKLKGSPQVLFPVGEEGGKMRNLQTALENGKVNADFPIYFCGKCNKYTIYPICEDCDNKTKQKYYCGVCKEYFNYKCEKHGGSNHRVQEIDVNHYFKKALNKINLDEYKELIKGVKGTSNKDSIPENLVKGILRAKNGIYVNKDGTTRYDMTEMGITAFKAKEINVSIEKLKELGYEKDIYGDEIKNNEQIIELKCQDIILPNCDESLDEGAGKVLLRVSKFVDDLLVKFYGLKKFYDLKSESELIGQLVVAMSPHTSSGVVARVIGFSKTQVFFAHPLFHSLLRRDADGDEACVMLLMDCLINFSRKYLPAHRGSTQDAPLVLTSMLIPKEVDDMVFKMDVVFEYPLELYEAAEKYLWPWEIKIETLGDNLGSEKQYENMGFTHDVEDMNMGVRCSAYKSIPTMMDKVRGQMKIADKIRAVDEVDVARLVIERHFIRDIRGNLRKFSMQQFRCVDCNGKYRRPPLIGRCLKCGGRIIFTIAEGSIVKYLEPSIELANRYELPAYLKQSLDLTKERIESVFGKDKEKQEGLGKWF